MSVNFLFISWTVLLLPQLPTIFQPTSPLLYAPSPRIPPTLLYQWLQTKLKLSSRGSADPGHLDFAVAHSLPCWDKTTLEKPRRTPAHASTSLRTDHPRPQELLLPVCVQHFKTVDIQQANNCFPSRILLKTQLLCNFCFRSYFSSLHDPCCFFHLNFKLSL